MLLTVSFTLVKITVLLGAGGEGGKTSESDENELSEPPSGKLFDAVRTTFVAFLYRFLRREDAFLGSVTLSMRALTAMRCTVLLGKRRPCKSMFPDRMLFAGI